MERGLLGRRCLAGDHGLKVAIQSPAGRGELIVIAVTSDPPAWCIWCIPHGQVGHALDETLHWGLRARFCLGGWRGQSADRLEGIAAINARLAAALVEHLAHFPIPDQPGGGGTGCSSGQVLGT